MFISFQATTRHVITHDLMWVMFPKLDVDHFKFLQGRSLSFGMSEI